MSLYRCSEPYDHWVWEAPGSGDIFILEKLKEISKPVFLVINKADTVKKIEAIEGVDSVMA